MEINYLVHFGAALIPMIVGALWYSNALLGKAWFKAAEMTDEKIKNANMLVIFGLSYLLSLLLAQAMMVWGIHQFTTQSLFVMQEGFGDKTGPYYEYFMDFMKQHGDLHRSFGHGAAHGILASIFIVLPIMGINSMFERRGWKYVMIHWGYWTITLVLMCGVLCQFA